MCLSELCLRMMISSSFKAFFVLIVSFCVVEGTLTPDGMVSVDCGSMQTFACSATGVSIKWIITGLSGINIPGPFLARNAMGNSRIASTDTGGNSQISVSDITISGFRLSDNGGTIQCINNATNNTIGIATISVDPLPLPPPTNIAATVESCNVTLQWDQSSEPNDITTSVSCTPPSPGCAGCTTSPCTITGLNPSTGYVFTVTLNSGQCRASMDTTTARTDSCSTTKMPITNSTVDPSSTPQVDNSPSSLAALVLIPVVLLIPFLYPLGVLIAYLSFFKDKSYCEVFWCCFFWRKDKSYECNSTELRPPGEEGAYQNVPKKKEFVTNGDEIKKPKRSKQEDAITDESLQRQGIPDGHHGRRRSRQHKEEVQYQNVGVANKKDSVSNGDEVKKPKRSKQEVVSTGNVTRQEGNPDGLQYADLDFSEQGTGRNVIHAIEDPVTYAEM